MLLVFRQHRLALSATGGASATLPASSDSLLHCGAAIEGLFLGGYKVVDFTFLCFFAGEPSSTPRSVKKKRQRSGSSIRCRRTFFI
jgi:hypothetical protein